MPREGEGHVSDNAIETGENQVHGAGKVSVRIQTPLRRPYHLLAPSPFPRPSLSPTPHSLQQRRGKAKIQITRLLIHHRSQDSHVDRANKAAPAPEPEKGGALEGFDASGGGSAGIGGQTGDGKGDLEPMANKTTGGGEMK